jgi:hypothetical protein
LLICLLALAPSSRDDRPGIVEFRFYHFHGHRWEAEFRRFAEMSSQERNAAGRIMIDAWLREAGIDHGKYELLAVSLQSRSIILRCRPSICRAIELAIRRRLEPDDPAFLNTP